MNLTNPHEECFHWNRQKTEEYSLNNNCTQESGCNENAAMKLHTCHSYDLEKNTLPEMLQSSHRGFFFSS